MEVGASDKNAYRFSADGNSPDLIGQLCVPDAKHPDLSALDPDLSALAHD